MEDLCGETSPNFNLLILYGGPFKKTFWWLWWHSGNKLREGDKINK
jgi:hypothetical protein